MSKITLLFPPNARLILLIVACVLASQLVILRLTSVTTRPAELSGAPTDAARKLYVVTPTYRRPAQEAELTRLAQTLGQVPHLHWLVVDDSVEVSPRVAALLSRQALPHSLLRAPVSRRFRRKMKAFPSGVANRNRGLKWIRENAKTGVVYFADDDNTYHLDLFEEMRSTKKLSMWPVGLLSNGVSTPVVRDGIIVGFYDGWIGGRKFPVDMAAFAVSVEFLLERPKAKFPYKVGYEETEFLESLAPFRIEDVELKADNCSRILVWHTQTWSPWMEEIDWSDYNDTNLIRLKELIG